jgi:thiamine monophosphate synthase
MQVSGYEFPIQLGNAFREVNRLPYEKNMHVMELYLPGETDEKYHTNAELISTICKNSGIVFIVKSRIDMAEKYQADGMIFDSNEDVDLPAIRAQFGADFIIGMDCKSDGDIAERYINNDMIDYITFDYSGEEVMQLVQEWRERSGKLCGVKGYITPEICQHLVDCGADFIGCGDFIWEQKEQVAEAVKEISGAINEAISGRNIQ